MYDNGQISPQQLAVIAVLVPIATAVISQPAVTAKNAGQGAWISILLTTFYGLAIVTVTLIIHRRFPKENLPGVIEKLTIKPLGRFLALIYSLWFLHTNGIFLREFGELLIVGFFNQTPLVILIASFVSVTAFAARKGLEVIGKLSVIFFSVGFPLYFVMLFMAIYSGSSPENLLPLWKDMVSTWRGTVAAALWMGELIIVSFLYPYLNETKKVPLYILLGIILLNFTLTATTAASISIFGSAEVGRQISPGIMLSRAINLANIVQRLEPILLYNWVVGVMVKSTVFLYISCTTMAQSLGLKDYRPLVIPLSVFSVILSLLLFDNYPQFLAFVENTAPIYAGFFEFLIPVFILLLTVIFANRISPHGGRK